MRQILPHLADIDPHAEHMRIQRLAPATRPWVMLNVVTSVDGATTVDGLSGPLGSDADKTVFSALRGASDVILAGATTVRAENYRAPQTSKTQQALRVDRGQRPKPRIAVVSRSLDLPLDMALFNDPGERPIVLTTADADPDRLKTLEAVAEVWQHGVGDVDLHAAIAALGAVGSLVVCEGGSTLNGQLIAEDLVDEVNHTVSPQVVAGDGPRLARGPIEAPRPLELAHLWEEDGMLLARYVTNRAS